MRTWPLVTCLILVAGCSTPAVTPAPAPSATPTPPRVGTTFAYAIDPVIANRYSTTGEVAWGDTGAGRRPSIFLLGTQRVEFEPGATDADRARFAADFDATLGARQVLPGTPDGSIPPKPTDTYDVDFRSDRLPLDGFVALGEAAMPGASLVFSSEAGARVFYRILQARQQAAAYRIRFIGINVQMCIPEDCGPDGGPVPSYPPVQTPPSPAPSLKPMELAGFTCPGPLPLGKQAVLRVTGINRDTCWAPSEVRAVLDAKARTVRIEATQRQVAETCPQIVVFPELETSFLPETAGTYTVTATVYPQDGSSGPVEQSCEVVVTAN